MNQTESTRRRGNLFLALVGMLVVPAFFLADTLFAVSRGWGIEARGNYGNFVSVACVAAMILAVVLFLVMLLIGPLRRALRSGSVGIFVFSCSIILGWFIAEGLLMIINPRPGFHLRPAGTTYVFQPDPFTMTNVSGEAVVSINSQGLRATEPPPRDEAYRIMCVGGSTTECLYLDDTETWAALLEQRLEQEADEDVWVAVAAVSELASPHHAKFIETSPLIAETDCVVTMPGINDFVRLLTESDPGVATPPLWYRSGLFAIAKEHWNASRGADGRTRGFVYDMTGEELDLHRLGMKIEAPEEPLDIPAAVEAYGKRIDAMCQAAKDRGVRLILVTQPVLWADYLSEQGNRRLNLARVHPMKRAWEYLEAPNLAEAMDQYNEKLIDVAEQTDTEYFDAAIDMSGDVKYFYDDYHFNESGCAKFAKLFADWFAEHPGKLKMPEAKTSEEEAVEGNTEGDGNE